MKRGLLCDRNREEQKQLLKRKAKMMYGGQKWMEGGTKRINIRREVE